MAEFQKIMTPKFRVAFPEVFTPRAFQSGQEPKYSVTMLFDGDADLAALKQMAKDVAAEKWPGKKLPKGLKSPFRDGDEVEWDGFAGCTFVRATSKYQPGIVGRDASRAIVKAEEFYAGCYARATVNCFAYDTAGNKGVAFGLQNIQFLEHGEPFTGRTNAEDDFDSLPDLEEGESASGEEELFDD